MERHSLARTSSNTPRTMSRIYREGHDQDTRLRRSTLRGLPDGADKPHVGIIGAGMAGLRCAEVLIQHGIQVTIIEGRDRIGGRVRLHHPTLRLRLPQQSKTEMAPLVVPYC